MLLELDDSNLPAVLYNGQEQIEHAIVLAVVDEAMEHARNDAGIYTFFWNRDALGRISLGGVDVLQPAFLDLRVHGIDGLGIHVNCINLASWSDESSCCGERDVPITATEVE